MSWMRLVAMNAYGTGGEKVRTTRLRIGQNYRAVCTQSRVPRTIAIARDGLSNDRRESATCFERPANTIISPPDHFLWGEGGEGGKMFVAT